MGNPGGKEIGRLKIRIVADASGERRKIEKELEGADAKVSVTADTLDFREEVAAARAEASQGTVTIEVDADVDSAALRSRVKAAVKAAGEGQSIKVPVHLQKINQAAIRANLLELQQRVQDRTRGWKPIDLVGNAKDTRDRLNDSLAEAEKALRKWQVRTPLVFGASLRIENLQKEIAETQALLDMSNLNVDAVVRMHADQVTRADLARMDNDWASFLTTLRRVEHEQRVGEEGWQHYAATFKRATAEADAAHKAFMDRVNTRNERVGVYAELLGRKMQLAFGSIAISGLTAGLATLGGYLGAGAVNAVALAGGLSQVAGAAVVLPGLFAGMAASIGVAVIGFNGFGEALKEVFASEQDPAKLEKALGKLAPTARKAAVALGELRPAFADLRTSIQTSLFDGLDGGIKRLDNFTRQMTPALTAIAAGWNATFKGLLSGLTSDTSIAGLSTTFSNFGKMMTSFAGGLPAMIQGFSTLSGSASKFFTNIGTYGANTMREFQGWVNRITTDGSLEQWVTNATMAFGNMWGTVKNLSSGLAAIFRVSGSQALLADLRAMAFEFKSFAESSKGQSIFANMFGDARTIIGNVHTALKPLGPMFVALVDGVAGFTSKFASAFGPALANGEQAMKSFMNMLQGLAEPIAKILGSAVDGIGKMSNNLGPSLARLAGTLSPFISELANFASGAGGVFINALTGLLAVVNKLASAIPGLSSAMGGFFAVMYGAKVVSELASKLGLLGGAAAAAGAAASGASGGIVGVGNAAQGASGKVGILSSTLNALKSIGPLVGLGLAVGLWEAAKAVADGVNPAVGEAGRLFDALPGKVASSIDAMKNGSQSLKTTLEQIGASYDQLQSKQMQAAQQMQDGFLNNVTLVATAGKVAEDSLKNSGSLGETVSKIAAKVAYENLPALTKAQAAVTEAQQDLTYATEEYGAESAAAKAASMALGDAQWALEKANKAAADSQQSATDKLKAQAEAQLSLISLDGAAAQSRLNLADAQTNYNETIGKFGEGSDQAKVALANLQSAMITAAQDAGALAESQAIATGASDGAFESYVAQRDALANLAATTTGPAHAAAMSLLADLNLNQAKSMFTAGAFDVLKGSIVNVPDSKHVEVSDNSGVIEKQMKALGHTVERLPNGNIVITAKDEASGTAKGIVSYINTLSGVITVYTNYVNGTTTTTNSSGVTRNSGGGLPGKARGGRIYGPGTPTSDDVPIMASRDEFMIRARAAKAIGYDNLQKLNAVSGINEASRLVGDITGKFAEGGSVNKWFRQAAAQAAAEFVDFNIPRDVTVAGGGGHTFIMPNVDPYSLAREVDRINGNIPEVEVMA